MGVETERGGGSQMVLCFSEEKPVRTTLEKQFDFLHVAGLATLPRANNLLGADRSARMRRLICAFDVCMQQSRVSRNKVHTEWG